MRTLAAVCVKNAVFNYWHGRSGISITLEEKLAIKGRLLLSLEEEVDAVALQLALIIGKIARQDFPHNWPELINSLMNLIANGSNVAKHRSLLSIHEISRMMVIRGLVEEPRQFQQLSAAIFPIISELWVQSVDHVLYMLSEFSKNAIAFAQLSQAMPTAEIAKVSAKILQQLVVYGFGDWSNNKSIIAFLQTALDRLKICVSARNFVAQNALTPYLARYTFTLCKMFSDSQKTNPVTFTPMLPACLDYFFSQIKAPENQDPNNAGTEKFIVKSLIFIKNVAECREYKGGLQAEQIVATFFTPATVQELFQLLITHYFKLSATDVQEWQNNPEEFLIEEKMDAWTEKRRPCAQNLFMVLIRRFPQNVPTLLVFLQEGIKPTANADQLLYKDACYSAIGLGVWELMDHIDFPQWFINVLAVELKVDDPNHWHQIIKRRIAWLFGQWVPKINDGIRVPIYTCLDQLLKNNDLVVRITAAEALQHVVNDFGFNAEAFASVSDAIFASLFTLLRDSTLVDSKLKVLNVIKSLIEQMEVRIRPYTKTILEHISMIWKQAQSSPVTYNHNSSNWSLIKIEILRSLTYLVKSIGDVRDFLNLLLPVIHYSTSINSSEEVYLLEDGLLLWHAVLTEATQMTPELLMLYPNNTVIMNRNNYHMKHCMKILEAYILLGQTEFVPVYLKDIIAMFEKNLASTDLVQEGVLSLLKPIEELVMLFPNDVPQHFEMILQRLLSMIFDAKENEILVTNYLNVFARLLLHNQNFFLSFFSRMSSSPNNHSKQNLLIPLLDIWVDKIDQMADFRRRKCSAIALSSLLTVPGLVASLTDMMALVVQAATGIIADEEDAGEPIIPGGTIRRKGGEELEEDVDADLLSHVSDAAEMSMHARSWQLLYKNDPITHITVRQYLIQQLQRMQQMDAQAFNALYSKMDTHVLKVLQPGQNPQ